MVYKKIKIRRIQRGLVEIRFPDGSLKIAQPGVKGRGVRDYVNAYKLWNSKNLLSRVAIGRYKRRTIALREASSKYLKAKKSK